MWFRKRPARPAWQAGRPDDEVWWWGLWHGGTCYPPPPLDELELFPSRLAAVRILSERYEQISDVDRTSSILLYDPQTFIYDPQHAQPVLRVRFGHSGGAVVIEPA